MRQRRHSWRITFLLVAFVVGLPLLVGLLSPSGEADGTIRLQASGDAILVEVGEGTASVSGHLNARLPDPSATCPAADVPAAGRAGPACRDLALRLLTAYEGLRGHCALRSGVVSCRVGKDARDLASFLVEAGVLVPKFRNHHATLPTEAIAACSARRGLWAGHTGACDEAADKRWGMFGANRLWKEPD